MEIYEGMTLKKTHLRKTNYKINKVNNNLIDPESYDANIKTVEPRIINTGYEIPPLDNLKWED